MGKGLGKTNYAFITYKRKRNCIIIAIPKQKEIYVSIIEEGNYESALDKAIKIRNKILDKIKYPYRYREGRKTNNSTKIVGVRRVIKNNKYPNGKVYKQEVYLATGKFIKGKLQQKSFSVKKYGIRKAKQMAIEYRRKFLELY